MLIKHRSNARGVRSLTKNIHNKRSEKANSVYYGIVREAEEKRKADKNGKLKKHNTV